MPVIELSKKDQQKYDHFVAQHPFGTIHQVWDWGLFQSKSGTRDQFWVFALEDERGSIQASALVIRQKMPFNKCWLYCPRGPLVDYSNLHQAQEQAAKLFEAIKKLASEQNAVFVRFDPGLIETTFRLPSARLAHAQYQPQHTLVIDLKPSKEAILAQMKTKGRYNIKIAQKHHIKVRESHGENLNQDLKTFYQLFQTTTARDNFSGHPLSYYENMLTILGPQKVKLYLAEYEGKALAGAIVTHFQDTSTYYFGASSNEHRNLKAAELIQWHAMLEAKNEGLLKYDLLGIAPENEPKHPWAGVTQFKVKFGGENINYQPAQEIVYQPLWYAIIRAAKQLKKLI